MTAAGGRAAAYAGILSLVWCGLAAADYWEYTAPMPGERRFPAAAVLNNRLYAAGGLDNGNSVRSNLYAFDGTAWSEGPGIPEARGLGSAAVLNGRLYLVGARPTSVMGATNVLRFDGAAWTEVAGLPASRGWQAAAAYSGYLYAIGGADGNYPWPPVTNVYRYDDSLDAWTEVAGLPAPRQNLAAAALGGSLYAIGGMAPDSARAHVATNVYRYDGTQWTETAGLPAERANLAAVVWSNRLYAIGGRDEPGDVHPVMYRHDEPQWTPCAGIARQALGAGVVNGTLYAVAGSADRLCEHGRPDAFLYTLRETLPAPTGVTASRGTFTNQVLVTWTGNPGATWYEVRRNTINNPAGAAGNLGGVDPFVSDSHWTVYTGIFFYYWVRAVNEAGVTSAFSAAASGYCAVSDPVAVRGQPAAGDYDGGRPRGPAPGERALVHLAELGRLPADRSGRGLSRRARRHPGGGRL